MLSRANDKAESKYNHDERPSKEDEERYQRLLSDNEELQRLISQVSYYSSSKVTVKKWKCTQKEEKIKLLRDRLHDKEKDTSSSKTTRIVANPSVLTQGKDTLIVADFITDAGTSDSAFGGCVSVYTRSSRCSQSDVEFSDSYL